MTTARQQLALLKASISRGLLRATRIFALINSAAWLGLLVSYGVETLSDVTAPVPLLGRLVALTVLGAVAALLVTAWWFRWRARLLVLCLVAAVIPLAAGPTVWWATRS